MAVKFSRRTVLRGAGGIAVALPFLASWRGDSAWDVLNIPVAVAADGRPKRIVFWVGALGTVPQFWDPINTSNNGKTWQLNDIMKPLEPYKKHMTVLSGINMASIVKQFGNRAGNHRVGGAHLLTSIGFDDVGDPKFSESRPRGPSIDQAIAQFVGKTSRFPSLFIGDGFGESAQGVIDARGVQPARDYQPSWLYDKLFKDFEGNPAERALRKKSRLSAVSAVLPSYKHLSSRLSPSDKRRLDAHLDGLSDIERRLGLTDACTPPAVRPPDFWDGNKGETYILGDRGEGPYDTFADLTARALACQMTNVVVFGMQGTMATPYDARVSPDLTAGKYTASKSLDMHGVSHHSFNNAGETLLQKEMHTWRMRKLANFVEKLSTDDDIDGRKMIENTCIVHLSEILTGQHDCLPGGGGSDYSSANKDPARPATTSGIPLFLLGGLAGTLKTDMHMDLRAGDTYGTELGKYSHGELYLTLARAMGISAADMPTFGEPEVCKRLVSEILV